MLFIEFCYLWEGIEAYGVAVMSSDEWVEHCNYAKKLFDEQSSWSFVVDGIEVLFSDYKDWLNCYTAYELTHGLQLLKDLNNGSTDLYYFGRFESPLLAYGNGALSNEDE